MRVKWVFLGFGLLNKSFFIFLHFVNCDFSHFFGIFKPPQIQKFVCFFVCGDRSWVLSLNTFWASTKTSPQCQILNAGIECDSSACFTDSLIRCFRKLCSLQNIFILGKVLNLTQAVWLSLKTCSCISLSIKTRVSNWHRRWIFSNDTRSRKDASVHRKQLALCFDTTWDVGDFLPYSWYLWSIDSPACRCPWGGRLSVGCCDRESL